MKKLIYILPVVISFMLAAVSYAQYESAGITPDPLSGRLEKFSGIGTRSGEFLNIPADARGVALGEAACAAVDDIGAIYWNPANLGFLNTPQVMLTNVNYALDFQYNYAAGVVPFKDGQGVFGAFMGILTLRPEEITTLMEPDGTKQYYDGYNMVCGATFAYNISDRFSAGANVKWVHEDIMDITANAFAIDMGANYHTEFLNRQIRVAFVVTNLGTNLRYTGDRLSQNILPEDERGRNKYIGTPRPERAERFGYRKTNSFNLPAAFKMGLQYQVYQDAMNTLSVMGEYQQPNYVPATFSIGSEYVRNVGGDNVLSARAGWKVRRDELDLDGSDRLRGLAVGGGVGHDFWVFNARADYAYSDNGMLGGLHYVSVILTF